MNRRTVLRTIGTAGLVGLAGCNESTDTETASPTPGATETATPTDAATESPTGTPTATPWQVDPLDHDKLIGAHYYPWYNDQYWADHGTVGSPVLGRYDSDDEAVINQHVKWAVEHGINWFPMSFWGPRTKTDRYIRNHFLEAELADEIDFSINFNSKGLLETEDNGQIDFDREQNHRLLRDNLRYINDTYFGRDDYLTIQGQPAMFVYAAEAFAGNAGEAWTNALAAIDSDPYLIAGSLNGGTIQIYDEWMDGFDAVTVYNPYDPDALTETDFDNFLEYMADKNDDWALAAEHAGLDFVPVLVPGYDDTAIRDNPVLKRDPDGFRDLCRLTMDRIDPDASAVLVTSFNEWPEYTAVEPGEAYGETYLDVIADEVARADALYVDPSDFVRVDLDFNRTIVPAERNPDSNDARHLAVQAGNISLVDGDSTLADYDVGTRREPPAFAEGAYLPETNTDRNPERWRWFGGPTERTAIYLDPDPAARATHAVLAGKPPVNDEIEADVYVDGRRTDHVAFGVWRETPNEYVISLTE